MICVRLENLQRGLEMERDGGDIVQMGIDIERGRS